MKLIKVRRNDGAVIGWRLVSDVKIEMVLPLYTVDSFIPFDWHWSYE